MEKKCNNEFIIEKIATNSHLQGNINIGKVPNEFLPNVGDLVHVVLDELVIQSNFIFADGFRINRVIIGNFLRQKNINIGNTFYIKICNNNTFYFYTNA